ncbi:hypothetical protein A9R01_16870 ['Osedax' symbiont bacterium Rs2_46_30_T18]|nr:hypothetical protein A9R01_16870 ['Osedax' symbiont bacterium Rs2_46_30_T18]
MLWLKVRAIILLLTTTLASELRFAQLFNSTEKWLAQELGKILELPLTKEANPYKIDMSSKNPRFTRKICFADQLDSLRQDTGE